MLSLPAIVQRAMQINGNAPATIMQDRVSTWKELGTGIALFAGGLKKLGVECGDRVAILAQNSDRYYLSFFAVSQADCVFVPVNTRLASGALVHWLADSGSKVVLVDDAMAPLLLGALEQLPSPTQVIYLGTGKAPAAAMTLESLLADAAPVTAAKRMGNDLTLPNALIRSRLLMNPDYVHPGCFVS